MKYRDLLNALMELDEQELDMDASIVVLETEEVHPVSYMDKYGGSDALDENHPIIVV
jgi:hypothetical protein